MRTVVIGATGHVGGYLVPRLVRAGHEVIAVSRGESAPYREDDAWSAVQRLQLDREKMDADGSFGAAIADLHPDVVVDMICFTRASAQQLVDALRGRGSVLVSCGSIWVHGTLTEVPADEWAPRRPWGEYGIGKAEIEQLLLEESRRADGVPSIVLHPGHISGPGWPVINPIGNLDLDVWQHLASGEEVLLPHFGLETVHHVHADDVAQAFQLAIENRDAAIGESFNVVSDRALTLRGFADAVAGWFGRDANLRFVSFDEFAASVSIQSAETSYAHIARSHSMSIEKARRMLGYEPAFSSLDAVREAVEWLAQNGRVQLPALLPTPGA